MTAAVTLKAQASARATGPARRWAHSEHRSHSGVNYGGEVPEPLLAVIAGLVSCQLALLLTTFYLHRTLSHRAVTMRPGLAFACRGDSMDLDRYPAS